MENLNNQGDCDDDRKQLLDKYRDVQKLKNEEINSLRAELTKGREENEKLSCQLSAIVKDSEAKVEEVKRLETEVKTLKLMNTELAAKGLDVTFCKDAENDESYSKWVCFRAQCAFSDFRFAPFWEKKNRRASAMSSQL